MRRRILVIDDNAAFRRALSRVLETERFTVIAEAATGASGVQLAREHQPDLVIVDVQLPDTDGFDVAEQLARASLADGGDPHLWPRQQRSRKPDHRELSARLHPEGGALRRGDRRTTR